MAHIVIAYKVIAYVVMAYVVMAYMVTADIVVAFVVMACTVMACAASLLPTRSSTRGLAPTCTVMAYIDTAYSYGLHSYGL